MTTLTIRKFGERLIETEDLDPVYVSIHRAKLPRAQLQRFLLAYWCFYHMGAAAYISEREGKDYWDAMMVAAVNEQPSPVGGRWPRASERRYFRGPKCVAAVGYFSNMEPEYWVNSLTKMRTEKEIIDRVCMEWPLFGSWIGFKIADMMERVVGEHVKFSSDIGLIYEAPRAGLDLFVERELQGRSVEDAYLSLSKHFAKFNAPPARDRPCGPQEVETILCKWKSHVGGRYEVGKDIAEIRHALSGGWGKTADKLMRAAPKEV